MPEKNLVYSSDAPTKREQAYEAIKELIITGKIPSNVFISERALGEMLGVSRTPIKAALSELSRERMLIEYPGKGFLVSHLSFTDLNEIYEIRCVLEPLALKRVIESRNEQVIHQMAHHLDEMKVAIEQMDYHSAEDHDMAFHDCYYKNSGNRRLEEMLLMLWDQIRRLLLITRNDAERIKLSYAEHEKIMHCILALDEDGTASALCEHLISSRNYHIGILPLTID